MRKIMNKFIASLCVAATIVSFSGTTVSAADGKGYWTTFKTNSLWAPSKNQYIHNRIETVGDKGYTPKAKVKYEFSDYEIYSYRAYVKFIYCITPEKELGRTEGRTANYVNPGNHEMIINKEYDGNYYYAIRPSYAVETDRYDLPSYANGMFYVEY